MKYSLFLADAPRTLGKPDYPSYPQLLSVECAAGSQARQLAQALPHSALTVAGRPRNPHCWSDSADSRSMPRARPHTTDPTSGSQHALCAPRP